MSSSEPPATQRDTHPLLKAVSTLLEQSLMSFTDDDVITEIKTVETAVRKIAAYQHTLLAEAAERHLPAQFVSKNIQSGSKGLRRLLMETLNLSSAEAGARVRAVELLASFRDCSGELLPPRLPATAAAQAEGAISAEHARVIGKTLNRFPGGDKHAEYEAAEAALAACAREFRPEEVAKIGHRILECVNPDGTLTTPKDRARCRTLHLGRQEFDGMSKICGWITPEVRALLEAVFAKLARPGINNPEDPHSPRGDVEHIDRDELAAAIERDLRSQGQRQHDALQALLSPGMRPDQLGTHRGLPVSLIMTMNIDQLETLSGVATTATGGTVPVEDAIQLAARAKPYLAIFDKYGLPLHFGQGKRLGTPAQRLALTAALRGCSRPGCDAPASMCAVHHVIEYRHGGFTDIEVLTFACDYCHSLIHDGPGGWKTVIMGPDSKYPGRTGWIAPAHIDPEQQPRVNHVHHPMEMLAETLTRIHERDDRDAAARRVWLTQRARKQPAAACTPTPAPVLAQTPTPTSSPPLAPASASAPVPLPAPAGMSTPSSLAAASSRPGSSSGLQLPQPDTHPLLPSPSGSRPPQPGTQPQPNTQSPQPQSQPQPQSPSGSRPPHPDSQSPPYSGSPQPRPQSPSESRPPEPNSQPPPGPPPRPQTP